jgi:hypothetical protein
MHGFHASSERELSTEPEPPTRWSSDRNDRQDREARRQPACDADKTATPFDLSAVRRKKLTADFGGGNQSSNGGVLLLRSSERTNKRLAAISGKGDPLEMIDRVALIGAQPKDELADIKTSNSDRDWDNAISSCGPMVPPCPPANGRTALSPSGARG